ncbi:MAG: phosphoenolpyruvate--protein phosphotransferase [Selenomonadaceae bacterium]|uniref:phosphoenolpyruvate--protein phosphotransferase n=1 Tax=Anaerovibrio slackiae TaxID=2652309 RepID=UPI00386CC39B|nr:phosphoenolpyruvate--protein phosphotransferase [Selenomonadaceae bacterium]
MPEKLQGMGAIPGVAIGKIMKAGQALDGHLAAYKPGTVEEELEKLNAAVAEVADVLEKSVEQMRAAGHDEQANIMEAHMFLAQDPMLTDGMTAKIEEMGNAPAAVLASAAESAAIFQSMDDEYLRERAADVLDVSKRIARKILGIKEPEVGEDMVVLCGYEVEPSVIAGVPDDKIAGVIMGQGSTTCHAVIIAKSRAIPTVVGIEHQTDEIPEGAKVVLDGNKGLIIIDPDPATLLEYMEKLKQQKEAEARYAALRDLPAVTKDGVEVQLAANIGSPNDAANAAKYGNRGVGLFRSEFVFMGREDIPSEEMQFESYKKAIEACNGELCVIRTMDIGGDKPLPYLNIPHEDNPFLGYRAIRISLNRRDLFMPQLKAILRAGVYGKAAIMAPMVVSVDEILRLRAFVREAMQELEDEGKEYSKSVQLGIMVETPAAAVMTPTFAKYVDFFSIGTNDLVQYTLSVDRVNPNVHYLYNHFHPAVLQLIHRTIKAANDHGIWAGMCGEMASDPYAAVILMAMGINELSMSAPSIPRVKEMIRSVTFEEAKGHLAKVMEMETGEQVLKYLQEAMER